MKITPTYHLFIILIFNVCFFSNLYSQINQNNLKFESSSYLLHMQKIQLIGSDGIINSTI
jgi:hypothetical protein